MAKDIVWASEIEAAGVEVEVLAGSEPEAGVEVEVVVGDERDHLRAEVERLRAALVDAKEHVEGAWSRLETLENDYPQEILIERASGNVQSALSAINEALGKAAQ